MNKWNIVRLFYWKMNVRREYITSHADAVHPHKSSHKQVQLPDISHEFAFFPFADFFIFVLL